MPRLVIRKGEGAGKDHALAGPCIVGRHSSANFVLGDSLVSRNHFRVLPEGGLWFVEDMGSTNGTIVNGRKAQKLPLNDGDVIVVGTTELQFVQKDPFASAAPRPAVAPPPAAAAPAPAAARTALPAVPVAAKPAPVAAAPAASAVSAGPPAAKPAPPALPAKPVPAAPAAAAAPAKAATPARPAPPPAPPAPEKPKFQAPVPTKRKR